MGFKSPLMSLVMVGTLVCAAIIIFAAIAALPQLAIAQQEDTSLGEEGNLADDIVSNVLDDNGHEKEEENDGTATAGDDDVNRQITVPIIDQDQEQEQGAANLAVNEALDVTVEPRPPTSQEPTPPPPPPGDGVEPECSLEITADKEIYEPEDVVAITITNTGNDPLVFPDSLLGLKIINLDTGEELLLSSLPAETTLESGESRTFQFRYEDLVREIGSGLISATITSECAGVKEVTFTLSAPPPPEEDQEEITTHYDTGLIFCNRFDSTPQQCDVPFRVTIETASVLKVGVTVSPLHCSSTNFYVSVDGDEDTFGGTFIGRAGYPAIFGGDDTLTIPLYDFGTVESGTHTLDIWVEGIPGGCNEGSLGAWGATLTVITSEAPEEDTTRPVLIIP